MPNYHSDSEKIRFIRYYSALIAGFGSQARSLAWWATWLSSKNRFSSSASPWIEAHFQGRPVATPHFGWREVFWAILGMVRYSGSSLVRVLYARARLWRVVARLRKKHQAQPVYLIKTFAYAHSFTAGGFRDVFFEKLPKYLAVEKHLSVLTVFDPVLCFRASVEASRTLEGVLPVYAFSQPVDLWRAWVEVLRGLMRPPSIPDPALWRFYVRDLLSPHALMCFMFYFAFKRLAEQFQLSHLLLTTENNPWERMCIQAVRDSRRSHRARVLGYQHTVVPEASVNMFPGRGELEFAPFPDALLTVGEEPAKILSRLGQYESHPIVPACALRFEYLEHLRPENRPLTRVLLVVLEGVPEAVQMLNYVLEQMRGVAGWRLVIRTHPALPLSHMRRDLTLDIDQMSHVEVSGHTELSHDLGRAGVVVYWGTSVALEALKLGIPVVHYDNGRLLSFDPLFDCNSLKWVARKDVALPVLLEQIIALPKEKLERARSDAAGYLSRYFHSVTPAHMDKFL